MKVLSIALFTALLASYSFAAEKVMDDKTKAMMEKMMAAGTPGEQHKKLAEMAGNWTYSSKMWEKADAAPSEESTGTSNMKMILGGRWLQQSITGTAMGAPFEGMGLTGYNNVTKKYETIWLDTFSTGAMKGSGNWDASSNTLKDSGKYACPMDNKERSYRGEWKIIDANNMVYAMYGKGMSGKGKEFKEMEMTFKRTK